MAAAKGEGRVWRRVQVLASVVRGLQEDVGRWAQQIRGSGWAWKRLGRPGERDPAKPMDAWPGWGRCWFAGAAAGSVRRGERERPGEERWGSSELPEEVLARVCCAQVGGNSRWSLVGCSRPVGCARWMIEKMCRLSGSRRRRRGF